MRPAVLLGMGVGDALGMPFETYDDSVHPDIAAWDGNYREGVWSHRVTQTLCAAVPLCRLPAGHWTDDTEMAVALAESLVRRSGFHPRDVTDAYVQWARETPHGAGATTIAALRRARDGVPWNECGVREFASPHAVGSGTAMRIAPLGVFYRNNRRVLTEAVEQDAVITHDHPEAVAGSLIVAQAVAAAARGERLGESLPEIMQAMLSRFDASEVVSSTIAAAFAADVGMSANAAATHFGRRGAIVELVPTALFCALRHADDFAAGVRVAIGMGGDADTRGAIVGAILGAYHGRDGIPAALRAGLYQHERLAGLDEPLGSIEP